MVRSKVLGAVTALATVAVVPTAATAVAKDLISRRQAAMKSISAGAKTAAQMGRGRIPFNAAKAAEAMGSIASNSAAFVALFPKDAAGRGETRAGAVIWQNFKDFEQRAQKLTNDASAAQKAAATGAEAFKSAFAEVNRNCKSCHDIYWKRER